MKLQKLQETQNSILEFLDPAFKAIVTPALTPKIFFKNHFDTMKWVLRPLFAKYIS